jgi:hypothetical protein
MWHKKLFPFLLVSFLLFCSNAYASTCTPPTPPSCIRSNPSEFIGEANDGTIYLPDGEYIQNGVTYNPPVATASDGCSYEAQSAYISAQEDYSICLATSGLPASGGESLAQMKADTQAELNQINSDELKSCITKMGPGSIVNTQKGPGNFDGCGCATGYSANDTGTYCVATNTSCTYGQNADGSCTTHDQLCVDSYGAYSVASGNQSECGCAQGYYFPSSGGGCAAVPITSNDTITTYTLPKTNYTPLQTVKKAMPSSVIQKASQLMPRATSSPQDHTQFVSVQETAKLKPQHKSLLNYLFVEPSANLWNWFKELFK